MKGLGTKYNNQLKNCEGMTEDQKFWKYYKQYKESRKDNQIKLAEWLQDNIEIDLLDKESKYYDFIKRFLSGETITNKYGRKLYWKY